MFVKSRKPIYDSSYFPQYHNLFFESDSIPLEQIKTVFYAKMAYIVSSVFFELTFIKSKKNT